MDMGRGEKRVRCMERVTWKQLTCPSTNDCLKKIIMQYHSIIENSEILLTFAAIWMDLENIILSEVC